VVTIPDDDFPPEELYGERVTELDARTVIINEVNRRLHYALEDDLNSAIKLLTGKGLSGRWLGDGQIHKLMLTRKVIVL
jgi:hypothetical protein